MVIKFHFDLQSISKNFYITEKKIFKYKYLKTKKINADSRNTHKRVLCITMNNMYVFMRSVR